MNTNREIAYRLDPVLWVREVLGITPRPWQETFLRAPRGASILGIDRAASWQNHRRGVGNGTYGYVYAWIAVCRRLPRSTAERRSRPQGAGNGFKGRCNTDH